MDCVDSNDNQMLFIAHLYRLSFLAFVCFSFFQYLYAYTKCLSTIDLILHFLMPNPQAIKCTYTLTHTYISFAAHETYNRTAIVPFFYPSSTFAFTIVAVVVVAPSVLLSPVHMIVLVDNIYPIVS